MRAAQGWWDFFGLFFGIFSAYLRTFNTIKAMHRSAAARGLAAAFATHLLFIPVSSHAATEYIYNSSGQLLQALADDGSSTQYQYDAAGNTIAIHQLNGSSVAITYFSPSRGPVGTSVTIWGNGFSPVLNQNAVTFNGVAATVTSAAATKLVASVPSGATTGPIAVTTTLGSATSSAAFIVGSPVTITSFSPSLGGVGTLVTINGSNFATVPANNQVKFNGVLATVVSASSGQLQVRVPSGTGSGRITVETPQGSASSQSDFFIPPTAHSVTDIGPTGRVVNQVAAVPYAIPSNKVGLFVFEGVVGTRYGLGIRNLVMSPASGGALTVSIYKPDGTLYSNTNCTTSVAITAANGGGSCDIVQLPESGTYTVRIDPLGSYSANYELLLSSEIVGSLSLGNSQPFTTARVGQNSSYTFSGIEGQNYSLALAGNTFPGTTWVYIHTPSNTELKFVNLTTANMTIDMLDLPSTGTYTVYMMPTVVATGTVNMTLQTDAVGTLPVDGSAVGVSLVAGQNLSYTFTGVAGGRYGVGISSLAMSPSSGGSLIVTVYKPDGTLYTNTNCTPSAPITNANGGGSCDISQLPEPGIYTVRIDPAGLYAANFNLLLSAEIVGTLSPGTPMAFSTTRVGQNSSYAFEGTAEQSYSLALTGNTFPGATWIYVYTPSNTELRFVSLTGANATIDLFDLPATGTYRVYVMPTIIATGAVNLTVHADAAGALVPNGATASISLAAGQNLSYTFTGTTGERYGVGISNLVMSPNTGGTVTVTIYKPDDTLYTLSNCAATVITHANGGGSCDVFQLTGDGEYTVRIDPAGFYTADFTLTLSSDATGTLAVGTPQTFSTARVGQNARYTFVAAGGLSYSLQIAGNTFAGASWLYIWRPNNTDLIANTNFTAANATVNLGVLPAGTYTVFFMPTKTSVGQVGFTLTQP